MCLFVSTEASLSRDEENRAGRTGNLSCFHFSCSTAEHSLYMQICCSQSGYSRASESSAVHQQSDRGSGSAPRTATEGSRSRPHPRHAHKSLRVGHLWQRAAATLALLATTQHRNRDAVFKIHTYTWASAHNNTQCYVSLTLYSSSTGGRLLLCCGLPDEDKSQNKKLLHAVGFTCNLEL